MTDELPPHLDLIVKHWVPTSRSLIIMPDGVNGEVHTADPDSWLNMTMTAALTHEEGVIVVVDQECDEIDIDPLVHAAWALPTTIVSAHVCATPGDPPEAWYEAVCPYAWAVTNATLRRILDDIHVDLPQTFGFELLIGEMAKDMPGVSTAHLDLAVAYLTENTEVSEARGNLYYREIADVGIVHEALGWTSPSS
jgi:hypothetical protein